MQINTSEVENYFVNFSTLAKLESVFVEKAGQMDSVILSAEHYRVLQVNQNTNSLAARKKKFETEFGDWIAAQNHWVEKQGIPGADLRPW
jgi:hypothetical protein